MKVVVLVSAIAEWKAVREIFPQLKIVQAPYGESAALNLKGWDLVLYHSGWGKIASAGMMQYVVDHHQPDLVVNLGTCGGFEGVVEQGDIVLVERTFIYDIVELMGDLNIIEYYASSLDLYWLPDPLPYLVRRGLIASADSDLPPNKIAYLKAQGAVAGDWESGALAWVANKNGARLLILRGVSDMVNEQEGEAYDNLALFEERTKDIMRNLFDQLPDWLASIRK
ncbi:MAG: 5'-methylthioadenosine/S-adenosylhomocysteine nucleosidase [Anaerolineales bacterium]|nr:5'-methylthioadenosine/S-adenosylhomocysteine nucleosidase [Anaerolineales bacterium]